MHHEQCTIWTERPVFPGIAGQLWLCSEKQLP
jgi:hypothetical protein